MNESEFKYQIRLDKKLKSWTCRIFIPGQDSMAFKGECPGSAPLAARIFHKP